MSVPVEAGATLMCHHHGLFAQILRVHTVRTSCKWKVHIFLDTEPDTLVVTRRGFVRARMTDKSGRVMFQRVELARQSFRSQRAAQAFVDTYGT